MNELFSALAKAQIIMTNAAMDRINPHFKSKYASLASVLDSIRKPLGENGLAIMQQIAARDGVLLLITTLGHSSGQSISSEYPLPAAGSPQALGSALTYARRYSLSALICTSADEDDDAENAETAKQRIRTPRKPAPNAMLPAHDPQTGEIVAMVPDGTPAALPEETATPAADPAPAPEQVALAGSGAALLEDQAREQAKKGERKFTPWFLHLSNQEKRQLSLIGEELRGLMNEADA